MPKEFRKEIELLAFEVLDRSEFLDTRKEKNDFIRIFKKRNKNSEDVVVYEN